MSDIKIFRVFIKATPQAVWQAITDPEWNQRYGYGGLGRYDLREGGSYRATATDEMRQLGAPELMVDGEIVELDPPNRLVQTWRMLMDPAAAAEGFTRLTYEIEEQKDGVTRLTVVHDVSGAPMIGSLVAGELQAEGAGGGWSWVLSDLKSLLETGSRMAG